MNSSVETIDELMLLVAESRDLHPKDSPAYRLLSEAAKEFSRARQRCLRKAGSYKVAVVGLGNVGKSTLINALLGEKVAPVRNGPCTASVVEFRHGPEYRIEASADTLMPEVWSFTQASHLHEKLSELVDHDSGESRAWTRLVAMLPASLLSEGLSLVDTPGFGAAGEVGIQDNDAVARFLREDVAQIFWVVMADQGILANEHRFYQKLLVERCDDLVVTNAEEWNQTDRDRWETRYRKHLSRRTRIFWVSGKTATNAKTSKDLSAWEKSGVDELEERIRLLASSPNQVETVVERIGLMGNVLVERLADHEFSRLRQPLLSPSGAMAFWARYRTAPWITPWLPLLKRA